MESGSKLDPEREQAILNATLELLAETGYEALRLDAVASRAKASKATLYRHWPGKAELVVDAVRCFEQDDVADEVDTGSLRGDVLATLTAMRDMMSGEMGQLIAGLVVPMQRDAELARRCAPRCWRTSSRSPGGCWTGRRPRRTARGHRSRDLPGARPGDALHRGFSSRAEPAGRGVPEPSRPTIFSFLLWSGATRHQPPGLRRPAPAARHGRTSLPRRKSSRDSRGPRVDRVLPRTGHRRRKREKAHVNHHREPVADRCRLGRRKPGAQPAPMGGPGRHRHRPADGRARRAPS